MTSEGQRPAAVDLRDIYRVLVRRRWLLLLPWAAAVVTGVSAALVLKPVFVSTVVLQLERPQPLTGVLGGMVGGAGGAEQQADVMREQVQSSLFLRSVIGASGVKNDATTRAWALRHQQGYPGLGPDEAAEAFLIDFLRDAIAIKRDRGNVFEISVADFQAERARRLAEAVANQFVLSSKAAQLEAVRATQEFSVEQQQVYKRKLDESEQRLEAARRASLSSSISGSAVNQENLARARTLLEQAMLDVQEQRQRLADIKGRLSGRVRENDPQLLSSPEATALNGQLVRLERQLAGSLLSDAGGGGEASVRMALARKATELEAVFAQSAARALPSLSPEDRDLLTRYRMAQADLEAKESRRAYLETQVGAYERQVVMSPDRELALQRLTQEVENNRALYNSFLQQSAAAQIAEAFENAKVSGRFAVIEPAVRPLAPSKPNRPLVILLSIVAGFIIGVGTVMVVESHDQSVKNADEIESLLELQVLGTVPRVEELQRAHRRGRGGGGGPAVPAPREHGLLLRLKVESPLGLEFRRVYLKLAKTRGRPLPRTILVTSSTRGEGKSTTAACLGITLAREHREKVLLVDFDLRAPALHRSLGLPGGSWGLSQMLLQRNFDERFVRSTVVENLDFLAAGKSDRPAAELVDTDAVEWFLREATARYPLVVMDCAPNLAVPDPLILGRAVEGVLFVVKAGSTVRKAAEYGVRVQREARDNLLGVLLNDVGEFLPHYYGYRYHYQGYGAPPEAAGGES